MESFRISKFSLLATDDLCQPNLLPFALGGCFKMTMKYDRWSDSATLTEGMKNISYISSRLLVRAALPLFLFLRATAAWAQSETNQPPLPPPGRLVAVGGWRLHIKCTGEARAYTAGAQQPPAMSPPTEAAIAFVNVSVISMDSERVESGQTVIVRGDRIAGIGASTDVPVPSAAIVIDGSGRYLVPGLTDAHVHLQGDGTGGTTRSDFGDAPLYLAHGVTTVFNLAGTPVHLDWRRRIESGELVGPTIYTSGRFVNEPRVSTEQEVEREVRMQAREGYDLIKFHEIFYGEPGSNTTKGLSLAPYLKMNEVAREIGIPLVGHAPVNLGLNALLQARQPLAHVGMLSNIYFLPLKRNLAWLLITAAGIVALIVLVVASGLAAVVRRWRSGTPPSRRTSRVRVLVGFQLLASVFSVASAALFLPGGPLFDSILLRLAFSFLILLMAVATVVLAISTAAIWRETSASPLTRIQAAIASSASVGLVGAALVFWLPVAWRSSDRGIERLARRIHDAGIPVQTTLVVYDALGGPRRVQLTEDPALGYLRADVRARWCRRAKAAPRGYRYTDFTKKVTGALHRAGVPLMAGTDAMGFPFVTPGSSLHHEIKLLTQSGLTPYEAMRAATVVPASFLGKDKEFGTIATGKRADLLLVEENPLKDVTRLRRPIGVMARGRWFTHDELQQMLTALAHGQ